MSWKRWTWTAGVLGLAVWMAWLAAPSRAEEAAANAWAAERAKLIEAIPPTQPGAFESAPNAQGDYVYEAASAKSLVEGRPFKIEPDTIVKGLTTAISDQRKQFLEDANLTGMYWRLKAIRPGRYWIGVVYQSGAGRWGTEAMQESQGVLDVHLNGRAVPSPTLSDPVQVAPGKWFAETQSAEAVALKEGDEVGVVANLGGVRAARLILHAAEFQRGAHRMRVNPGPNLFNQRTSVGLSADCAFLPAQGKPAYSPEDWSRKEQMMDSPEDFLRGSDGRPVARCTLANPLPVPVEVDYECVVLGYYRQQAGRDAARLTLPAHSLTTREIPFETTPDDPGYSITATLKAVNPPDLGWPPYDEFAFFPGLRHLVPWTNPFEYMDHRRISFCKQKSSEDRQKILLQGGWERAFTAQLDPPMPPPADLKFQPCQVPFWKEATPGVHGAYFRRKFTLPEGQIPRVCRLVVEAGGILGGGVSSEGTMYVNGRKVGAVRGFNTPLIGDATEAVRPGENDIVVIVRDVLAVMNPDYVDPKNPTPNLAYMDAPGDCNASVAMGSVWMELTPQVSVESVKVDTSVRKRSIEAQLALANRQAGDVRLHVKVAVEDARKIVLALGEQDLVLKPGESKPLKFQSNWDRPRLWSWNEPNLYVLAVEVTDAASGKRLDLTRERFGFRETWIEGSQIMFNGHPVRLKCAGRPCVDVQVGRGATVPDYTDETGFLVTELVTGLVNSSSRHNVERDVFWRTAHANTLAMVRRKWNHPSILAWDLSNEWFSFAIYGGADMALAARRFQGLGDAVEQLDPTRWTFFNGDEDVGGLHNNISTHYMLDSAHPSVPAGFGFNGHSVYLPDGAFWRPLDRDFLPGEEVPINAHRSFTFRYGSKVIMDTENLWKVSGYQPPGPCKFVGEEEVLSSAIDLNCGPWVWMWKQNVDGHRDLGVSLHSLHEPWQGVVTRGHMIQTFIMPDTVHHAFAGGAMDRSYSLLNDLFRSAKMTFRWRLVGRDGKTVGDGSDEREVGPGATVRGSLSLKLPQVAERTGYTLQLRLESDGKFVCGEDRDIDVWPDAPVPVGRLDRKLALYDPRGATAKAFKAAGVQFEAVEKLAAPKGEARAWTLVVGEEALDQVSAKQAEQLGPFVEAGGRVVFLAQTVTPSGLPVKTTLENREWSSQPFVRLPIHPVLDNFTSWDLHFWAPDRVSSRGAYSKPDCGPAITLVDSGTNIGLEWVQMMEAYRGSGLYLLCQLPLAASYDREPMARELLARVLRYAGGAEAFRAPAQRLHLLTGKKGLIERRLEDVGVDYETAAPDALLDPKVPTLVDGGIVPTEAQQAAWKAGLADGATLVVVGAQPEAAPWLSALAGKPVRIAVPRYRMWEGRGYRAAFDPLIAGLSHLDIYWKQYDASHLGAGACQTEDPEYMIEPLQDWSVAVEGGRELIFPGALTVVNVAKGRLVLDQRRWMTAHDKLTRLAERNLSSLALGLNLRIASYVPPRELPSGVAYRPLDLTAFCNRGLADDVASDGKGGWSDQGPLLDMRDFPTGRQSFDGVPFLVGAEPRCCIVLKNQSQSFSERLPDEAVIPVGYAVEGLWFLHSAAYSGSGLVGLYEIQYADGASLNIPLMGGENIRDWVDTPGPLPHEKGTQSKVAWTGKTKVFPTASVFQMLWVNPRPDVPVKTVRFDNPERKACAILIALTAAVKQDHQAAAADQAKAQELLKQAQQALDAKKTGEAKDLLKQAIALDARTWTAHEMLADLAERGGSDGEKLDVYRAWTAAGAPTPAPYNRLGELLEKRGDYKGALDAFTRSLKIEWNQPPVIDAKARMEKLGK